MRYYFSLQFRMINRQLAGWGINPLVGYLFVIAGFTGFSLLLFEKMELAPLLFVFMALAPVTRLSEQKRNDFLKTCFNLSEYYQARILENTFLVLPFVIFLAFRQQFLYLVFLFTVSVFMAMTSYRNRSGYAIPTPFYRWPFEFASGFRGSYFLFLLAFFLAVMSAYAGNFNIGIFAMILVYLVCISYYFKPEEPFFVWIYSTSPAGFLKRKIMTAFMYSTILALPVTLTLFIFYPDNFMITVGFFTLGQLFVAMVILAKYSAYPEEINLPQFIIMALCIWFPPLLAAVIPYFYLISAKKLRTILG